MGIREKNLPLEPFLGTSEIDFGAQRGERGGGGWGRQ